MRNQLLHSCPELIDYINEVGFLPLLRMGVAGWSAEEMMDEDCQYTKLPDGGWEWPLWSWKGPILQDTGCAYGKFFDRKAAFISREWWPDFCNYRRSLYPYPEEGSVEESILFILKRHGSLITRELRAACGFTGPKTRSRFDAYLARLHRHGRFRLSTRPPRAGIWLGLVPAHDTGNPFRTRSLPSRPNAPRVIRTVAGPLQENPAG